VVVEFNYWLFVAICTASPIYNEGLAVIIQRQCRFKAAGIAHGDKSINIKKLSMPLRRISIGTVPGCNKIMLHAD
jgi:hypothetical protein